MFVGTIEEAHSHARGLDLVVTCAELLQRGLAARELTEDASFTLPCGRGSANGWAGRTRLWLCLEQAGPLVPIDVWRVFWPIERLDDIRAMVGPHVMAPQL